MYKKGTRGKARISPQKRKITRTTSVSFYLLPKSATKTPKGNDEFKLIQAGLGKRSLLISDDMDHAELSSLLCKEFPKIECLKGGWLLYKAIGGSGQRPPSVIAPESEGYTGGLVTTVSSGGKSILYIVPLQVEIDMTPLPPNAQEFQKMPRTQCSSCSEEMPLQVLAVHYSCCNGNISEGTSDNESTITMDAEETVKLNNSAVESDCEVEFVSAMQNGDPSNKREPTCPICQECFPLDLLEVHASVCGESRPTTKADSSDVGQEGAQSLDDLLQNIADQVDESEKFSICITRSNRLQQWQRQKKSTPKCSLHVCYMGEAGVDTGALKKEFLTDMMSGIETHFFEPSIDGKGKNPIYSITALDQCYFRTFGEIFAASLAQGGPLPNFMRDWCYTYLATGDSDKLILTPDDVTDQETRELIIKVTSATAEYLPILTDDILSCGYTGVICIGKQEQIIRTIVLHSLARLFPMLQQLCKGLQLYNLHRVLELNTELCRPLFVPLQDDKPDADFIMKNCTPHLSEKGTTRHIIEMDILNNFQDFLQEAEDNGADNMGPERSGLTSETEESDTEGEPNTRPLTVPAILQWLTGQAHKPILPSEKSNFKIHIKFNHDCDTESHNICFPIISACSNTITFPTAHMKSYKEFKNIMTLALRFGNAFSRV